MYLSFVTRLCVLRLLHGELLVHAVVLVHAGLVPGKAHHCAEIKGPEETIILSWFSLFYFRTFSIENNWVLFRLPSLPPSTLTLLHLTIECPFLLPSLPRLGQ